MKTEIIRFSVFEMLGIPIFILLMNSSRGVNIAGFSLSWIAFFTFAFFMVIGYRHIVPRCPSCGLGLYSLTEYNGYPLIVKTWIGKNCAVCGARFK